MNEHKNIRSQLADERKLYESVQRSTDELIEVEVGRLEEVAGGGDGTAIGLGKN